jgi:hypothetical protein
LQIPYPGVVRLDKALVAESAEQALDVLLVGAGASIARFEEAVPPALAGGFGAVQVLVSSWDSLLDEAVVSAASVLPRGALEAVDGQVVRLHGKRVDWLTTVLRTAVADAPFSTFVGAFGPGPGMALACVAEVRAAIPDLQPLLPPSGEPPDVPADVDVLRFRRLVDLTVRGLTPPLERLQEALGLSSVELGQLFGVSRQAIDQWKVRGVPADRRSKLGDLLGVVDLLERKLRPGRLPLVGRRPAAAFDGRTLLDLAAEDGHEELRATVERAFDWSTTA